MEQDGKEYRPITELSKADADALLGKAAVSNEQNGFRPLLLYAFPRPHSAQLVALPFAKVARAGNRMIKDVQLVPMTTQTAKELMGHNDATLESYLAIDPTLYPDTHPFADHLYKLDVPQTITREQVYFRCDDEDAKIETAPGAKMEAAPSEETADDEQDERLAALFDPVPVEALEKMFHANGKWSRWAEKAKANGLIDAREGRARFNPYKAGVWFVRKGMDGWDDARLSRTLANNLPARSRDNARLLTGNID